MIILTELVKENVAQCIENFEIQGVNWYNDQAPILLVKFIAKSA